MQREKEKKAKRKNEKEMQRELLSIELSNGT